MKRAGFQKFLKKSQDVLEEIWGDEINLGGTLYPCAIASRRLGGTMGQGGNIKEGFLNLRIRKSVLPTKPEDGVTFFIHEGRRWRVDEVKDQSVDDVWALSCIPDSE
jgi:hypothetical protein